VTADDFATSVDRLLNQVGHWEQARWWTRIPGSPARGAVAPTGGDRVYALVQRLADLAADAEHQPRRPVPRVGDLVLRDQLRVMSDDLLAAGPSAEALRSATAEVDAFRRIL
jgi:hypothetical protein